MPTPVNSSSASPITSGHYDTEAGQCVAPVTQSPRNSSSAPAVSPDSDAPSRAAVEQLVKGVGAQNSGSCVIPVLEATVTCAGAALTIVVGASTGIGAVAGAAITGAACGVKVMSAEECVTQ